MTEIIISAIAKLAEYLVGPLVRKGHYLLCADNIAKTLENEKQELESKQGGVQAQVQEALNKTENINVDVDKWLTEVETHIGEVQKLEQQMNESNSCFKGRCPTWRRYRLCRQMIKKIEATTKLIQRGKFDPFSTPAPIPDIEYFSSGNFMYFQSTKLASDQLLAALQDNGVPMIGLYGMGGSGKTTLVKEVGKRAKELNIFDRVIFATVSQTLNIRKLQGEIADHLSLGLHEESEVGRAKRLAMRLSNGERILIILDDVWVMINLKDIGIPFEDYRMGCKVLLTTRLLEVCHLMDCERKIHLNLLSDEESWTLFQKHARIVDESLDRVAQEIVRECKGLPIAIQAIGASLKGKSIEEWKDALGRLRDSKPIDVAPGIRDAFSCLRLSYDYLRNKEVKSLFLLCCMYPEDADISVEHLFRITMGLDIFEESGSLERARGRVSACIERLVNSCLLMRSEKWEDHLRMHDTVRDAALWISSQENRTIIVNREKDMKVASDGSIKDCYAFTSWCNKTTQFPQRLDAPKLEILLLTKIGSCELSETYFGGMGELKVMEIRSIFSNNLFISSPSGQLSLLPDTMNLLTNLRFLCLQGLELVGDLSWVVGLKSLEVLDLRDSNSSKDLPQGLEELSKLKLLGLESINEQSFKIIERCTQLQELYVSGEIQLSRTTLELGNCLSNNGAFPILKRYQLHIGENYKFGGYYSKDLSLRELQTSNLSPFIYDLLQRAEAVSLERFNGGCKNIVPNIVQLQGMNELASLRLDSCSDIECLVDATSHHIDETLFSPEFIRLESLDNLKEIWHGPPLVGFFQKLQVLDVYRCPKLTSLFPKHIARAEMSLQKLTVTYCSELRNIIEEDGDGANSEIISASNNNVNLVFSKLKSLTITGCDKLEYVFSNSCVQGLEQLEEVRIVGASQLKYAFGQHEDVEHQEDQIKLPVLESLRLKRLENLLSIFPESFHSSCPCLRELHWAECPNFRASCVNITIDSNTLQDNQLYSGASAPLSFLNLEELKVLGCSMEDILFPLERNFQNKIISSLNTLELKKLPELKFIWGGPVGTLSLENLRRFRVSGCNNLRSIFSPVILKCLPLLEGLEISDCNELEEIMSGTEAGEQHQDLLDNAQSPQICFPNLKRLDVERCNKLKCLFSVAIDFDDVNILPNLWCLILQEVPSLENFCQGLSLSNACLPQLLGSKPEVLCLESPLDELWVIWRAPSHTSNLAHLRGLTLTVYKMKSVFGDEGIHLPMLERLTLSNCEELEEVATQDHGEFQTSFPELKELSVRGCNKLKCLFSTSSITTVLLPRLDKIEISECAELEQLFRHNNETNVSDIVNKIVLPNLTSIQLMKLPSLVHIGKGFKLSAVNIERITMTICPKFSSIMGSTGSISTSIKRKEAGEPHANNGNNRLLHQLAYFYPTELELMELQFQELSELSFMRKAFTSHQNLSFQYLVSLTVHGCGKVKCIFPMSVWGSLPRLMLLKITECEELEEIILQDLDEEEAHHQNVSNSNMQELPFPGLFSITVKGCNKLKCLLRNFVVGMLPQLGWIKVSEAAQMEELFSHQGTDANSMQDIVLPNLQELELSELPALTHFCKGFNLVAPELGDVQINECPKFDFSFHQDTSTQTTDDESSDGEQRRWKKLKT